MSIPYHNQVRHYEIKNNIEVITITTPDHIFTLSGTYLWRGFLNLSRRIVQQAREYGARQHGTLPAGEPRINLIDFKSALPET